MVGLLEVTEGGGVEVVDRSREGVVVGIEGRNHAVIVGAGVVGVVGVADIRTRSKQGPGPPRGTGESRGGAVGLPNHQKRRYVHRVSLVQDSILHQAGSLLECQTPWKL